MEISSWASNAYARDHGGTFITLLTISMSWWALSWPTTTQDEFSLLIYPDLILDGRAPNEDFFSPYGPGTYLPMTLLYAALGGSDVYLSRVVGMAYHVLLALGVWSLTRHLGRLQALIAGTSAGLLCAGLTLIPYGWLLASALTTWSLSYGIHAKWRLAGLCAGLAGSVRPEFLLAILPANVALMRGARCIRRYLFGFAIGLVPLIVFAIYGGGLRVLRNVFVDRFGADTSLRLLEASSSTLVGLSALFILVLALTLRALQRRDRVDIAIAMFCFALLPQAVQRVDRDHVLFVACVVGPIAVAHLIPAKRFVMASSQITRRHVVSSLGFLAVAAGTMVSDSMPDGTLMDPNRSGRSFYVASPQISLELSRSMRLLESHLTPNSQLLVVPGDLSRPAVIPNYIYYLFPDNIAAAYFLELAPGVSEKADSGMLSDLKKADVLIISHFSGSQRRLLFPRIAQGSEQGNVYVEKHFCKLVRIPAISVYPRFDVAERCVSSSRT
jgi:hypothetical protein